MTLRKVGNGQSQVEIHADGPSEVWKDAVKVGFYHPLTAKGLEGCVKPKVLPSSCIGKVEDVGWTVPHRNQS